MPLAAERDRIAKQLPEATLIAIQDAMENEFEEIDKLDRFADAEYPDVSEVAMGGSFPPLSLAVSSPECPTIFLCTPIGCSVGPRFGL